MKIDELSGYKTNPHYQQANAIFKNPKAHAGTMAKYEREYNREDQLTKWQNYMTDHGFKYLGSGNFAGVYEHPNYPWIFKIFKDDPGYIHFFKYAKTNQHNENLPKIKGNLIKINDTTYVIRVEKLSPMSNTFFNNEFNNVAPIFRLFARRELHDLDQDYQQTMLKFKEKYPGIFTVLYDMAKSNYLLDLSSRNMMMRGDIPVITDPIF
jgi:hypothetical protein